MRSSTQGGLEGCKPSKKHRFLVVCAGKAGTYHQKWKSGEASPPQTPPLRNWCHAMQEMLSE
jgi:hypothetical protein